MTNPHRRPITRRSRKKAPPFRSRRLKGGGYCSDILSRKDVLSKIFKQKGEAHRQLSRIDLIGYQACKHLFARKSFALAKSNRYKDNPIVLPDIYASPDIVTTLHVLKTSSHIPTPQKRYISAVADSSVDLEDNAILLKTGRINNSAFHIANKAIIQDFTKLSRSISDGDKIHISKIAINIASSLKAASPKAFKEKVKKLVRWRANNEVRHLQFTPTGSIKLGSEKTYEAMRDSPNIS